MCPILLRDFLLECTNDEGMSDGHAISFGGRPVERSTDLTPPPPTEKCSVGVCLTFHSVSRLKPSM